MTDRQLNFSVSIQSVLHGVLPYYLPFIIGLSSLPPGFLAREERAVFLRLGTGPEFATGRGNSIRERTNAVWLNILRRDYNNFRVDN